MELVGEGVGCCVGRVEAQGIFVAGPGEAGLGPLVLPIPFGRLTTCAKFESIRASLTRAAQQSEFSLINT